MTFGYCNGKHNGTYKNEKTGHTGAYGDGNYCWTSSPCCAAVHKGVITTSGGFFEYWLPGHINSFSSSTSNGITTQLINFGIYWAFFNVARIQI